MMTAKRNLSAADAAAIIENARAESHKRGHTIAVAVVDSGGHLLAFQRDDGTMLGAIDAAVEKAQTANFFRRATAEMQEKLEEGKLSYLSLPNCLPMAGGVPIGTEREIIGGLGISGAPSETDSSIAGAVIAWWTSHESRGPSNV